MAGGVTKIFLKSYPRLAYPNFIKFFRAAQVHLILEHVHVTYDTLSLDSTSILAQTRYICQVHFIQTHVTEPPEKLAHWRFP